MCLSTYICEGQHSYSVHICESQYSYSVHICEGHTVIVSTSVMVNTVIVSTSVRAITITVSTSVRTNGWHKLRDCETRGPRPSFICETKVLRIYNELRLNDASLAGIQTWNLSQAPQACLCKILLVWVKSLRKHTQFLSQFGLVCVEILGIVLTRDSLHYT